MSTLFKDDKVKNYACDLAEFLAEHGTFMASKQFQDHMVCNGMELGGAARGARARRAMHLVKEMISSAEKAGKGGEKVAQCLKKAFHFHERKQARPAVDLVKEDRRKKPGK